MEIPPWLKALPLAPEYHPTEEEFLDPIGYILRIEPEAARFGVCKIVPPYLKPPKRAVINNLNSSLALSHDAPPASAHGSSVPLSRSMCPARSMGGVPSTAAHVEAEAAGGKAKFTTRRQQLGWSARKSRAASPQAVTHKLVWQSGETYTLDQFEAKAKLFSRNRLGTAREVAPMTIETLFWRAACEKAIAIEYANDISGSAFAEPSDPAVLSSLKHCRSKWGLDGVSDFDPAGLERQGGEEKVGLAALLKGTGLEVNADSGQGSAGCKLSNSAWNMRIVARSPGSLLRFMPDEVPGVTSPMVYIGMLFSWFAWHVEDHELHSLNYLHTGAPKTWYAVPGEAAPALEEVVRVHGYGGQLDPRDAFARLGEKTTVMSPEVLIAAGVPCCRLVQNAGEYVVTFPRAYHLGFSHGFNCGEAANFATPGWLDVAREAAARRAAMNYLPMLSHQQLLYMLAMSLMSRSPSNKEQHHRLTEKKKAGEEIVKSLFLNDVIHHNKLLGKLLNGGVTSCLMLRDTEASSQHTPSTITTQPSVLSNSLTLDHNSTRTIAEADDPNLVPPPSRPDTLHDRDTSFGLLTDTSHENQPCAATTILSFDASAVSGEHTQKEDKEPQPPPQMLGSSLQKGSSGSELITSLLPLDWGTLPCAACGILCYSAMAVVQPSQTAAMVFKPLQTHALGGNLESSLAGAVPAKADSKSADFHMLPSPGLLPLLEYQERMPSDRLADVSHESKDGELESLTEDLKQGFTSSTDCGNKAAALDTQEAMKSCSAPIYHVANASLQEDVPSTELRAALSEAHSVEEPGPPCTQLDEKATIPWVSDVLRERASYESPVARVQETATSGRQQHSDELMPGRKLGEPNGEATLSSLQLLAAVYDGESEVDEADEREEERGDPVEEVSVVGVPHIGTGGRHLDSVGLSADAPWDGISRSVPGIDRPPSLALRQRDSEAPVCRFTSCDVLSASQAMARIFSRGGLLYGVVHEGSRAQGAEFQDPPAVTDINMAGFACGEGLQCTTVAPTQHRKEVCGANISRSGAAREGCKFDSGSELAKKPAAEFAAVRTNESRCDGAGLMNVGNLEAIEAGKFASRKLEANSLRPPESGITPHDGERMCCVELAQLGRYLRLAAQRDDSSSIRQPPLMKIKHAGSSPCEPRFKLSAADMGAALKGDTAERLVPRLGECVTCSLPHDSFFDSFEETTTVSPNGGTKDVKVCADRSGALVAMADVPSLGSVDATTAPEEAAAADHTDLVKRLHSSRVETTNGHGADTRSAVRDVVSVEPGDVADECGAQALARSAKKGVVSGGDEPRQAGLEAHVRAGTLGEGAARPRVLCLEHAVVAQHLLEPFGGAHVVIVCHSSFANTEQRAKEAASEMGMKHEWKSVPMQKAGDKEVGIITAAVEAEEENSPGQSDWVGQLGLSTHNLDRIYRDRLNMGPGSERGVEGRGGGGRVGYGGREWKEAGGSQWCGRGWQPDELHPLLGGCRFMASMAEITVLPATPSLPGSLPNLAEHGRPRRVTRLTRLGESSGDGRPHLEVRKSGRKRRTVLDSAVDQSDEEGQEQNRVVTIVCSNITATGARRTLRSSERERSPSLEHASKQAPPAWEKLGKRKKKDADAAKPSPRSPGNSAPEAVLMQEHRCPAAPTPPFQWQYDSSATDGSCVPPSDAQPFAHVEGDVELTGGIRDHSWSDLAQAPVGDPLSPSTEARARTQAALDDNSMLQILATPQDEVATAEATEWLSALPSPRAISTLKRTSPGNSSSSDAPFVCSSEDTLGQTQVGKSSEGHWREVPISSANVLPLPVCLSGRAAEQPSQDDTLVSTPESQVPPKAAAAAVGESTTRLHPCPDGDFHSEASKCCSVVGGFLQRGAKLQALQKLCRQQQQQQQPLRSESCSPPVAHHPARIASRENLSCSNVTTPRLVNRPKRKSAAGASSHNVKKPKRVGGGRPEHEGGPPSWDGENSTLSSLPLHQVDHGEEVQRARRRAGSDKLDFALADDSDSRVEESDTSACKGGTAARRGASSFSCDAVECAQVFETDDLLESHWQACHTLPPQTPNLNSSSLSIFCTESSSQGPSNELAASHDLPWQCRKGAPPLSGAPAAIPRQIGRARGRRTKGLGWKSCIQMSPPARRDETSPCQSWDEDPVSCAAGVCDLVTSADADLNTDDCGLGVDADPDFSPYLSCLTSTSSRLRRRRVSTPGMAEWGGGGGGRLDDEGVETTPDPDDPADDEAAGPAAKRRPARKKPRRTAAQKRLEEPEGAFPCDVDGCTMGFDTEQDLQLHKRNRCTWKGCGKHFHMHKYLLQHRRVHLDDRPLKCPWKGCPQAFKWAWARTEHIRVHTGERPYKCGVAGCGQTFRFVSDFSRHKRNTGHRPSG